MTATQPPPTIARFADGLTSVVNRHSRPKSPQVQLIKGPGKAQLFVVNGSRLHDLSAKEEAHFTQLLQTQDEAGITEALMKMGLQEPVMIDDEPLQDPPLYALSLAIAQKCNMGCGYCYAEQGDFGGPMKNMSLETAMQSIDLLLKSCPAGGKVQLTFLGGEPLVNRTSLWAATAYAHEQAQQKNITVHFSITTNGTLVTEEDAHFFEKYGFAVTVSLDGLQEEHDKLRPMKGGQGSFEKIMKNIQPLLRLQKKMQVSARVTVTPQNMNLAATLETFIQMGFHSVGFSPLLNASNGRNEMEKTDLGHMLRNMIECGLAFENNVLKGKRYPFLNMVNGLQEIAKSTHRPYPCGAGAGYMGVSAEGELSACHRFVNEPAGKMGDLENGIDPKLQNSWLANRHVHTQSPCNQCWARYLCGGGCHHEVIEKGRPACDYIRGWLYYLLQAHDRLGRLKPDLFH
ncbi:MAG: radical SAM protein [Bacteroidota bacterium]